MPVTAFIISHDLNQMVKVPTRILDCYSHSSALLDLYLLTLVFVLQWLSLHWEILIIWMSQLLLTFRQTQIEDTLSHCIASDYSRVDWDGLPDHLRDIP